jgi:hypothetical protein
MGYDFFNGIYTIAIPMKLFRNKIIIASVEFFFLNLAGAFIILAPLLVLLRNRLSLSGLSLKLWPVISPDILTDILVNETQMLSTYIISAMVIFTLYAVFRAFFSGGIHYFIVRENPSAEMPQTDYLKSFIAKSAELWISFLKVSLLSIVVYMIAAFLGFTIGSILSALGAFWRVLIFLIFLLIGSTFLQMIRIRLAATSELSVLGAIRGMRQALSKSLLRIILGNLSVSIAGILLLLLLWVILKAFRAGDYNAFRAFASVVLEQAIVFVICLMQVIRINYNHSIIKRGTDDSLGGTQLG